MRRAVALLAALSGVAASASAFEGDPSKAGAYCRLPEPGEKSACLLPAQARYGNFFEDLESGEVGEDEARQVEEDLRNATSPEEATLALSTLSYGYWRVAMRAADGQANPELVTQLQRWNGLLADAYAESEQDSPLHGALIEAANDLHARAPEDGIACVDSEGRPARCRPTDNLLETIEAIDGQLGMGAAIRTLLNRVFEDPEE